MQTKYSRQRLLAINTGAALSIVVPSFLFVCIAVSAALPLGAEAQQTDTSSISDSSIVVRTENYHICFSTGNGAPIQWDLLILGPGENGGAPEESIAVAENRVPFIDQRAPRRASGWPFEILLPTSPMLEANDTPYTVRRESDEDFERIKFTSEPWSNGLTLVKTYSIRKQGFETAIDIQFMNGGTTEIIFDNAGRGPGVALGPGLGLVPADAGFLSYTEAVFEKSDEVTRLYPDHMETSTTTGGPLQWAGIHNQYFLMALFPADATPIGELRTYFDGAGLADEETLRFYPRAEIYAQPMRVGPGETGQLTYTLFAGPKDRKILRTSDARIEGVLYSNLWGWLAGFCTFFERILGLIHIAIPNWGLAIIALAILLRVILYPLSKYGHRHQKEVQKKFALIKPLVAELKSKYKDNAVKRHEETIKLHKEHGLNPLSQLKGSLPLLIQLPVLVALYHVLGNSFEIRGVTFLWIGDLSLTDRLFPLGVSLPWLGGYFNLLPVIMFAAQIVIARNMGAMAEKHADEKGKRSNSIYLMPVIMLLLFYPFPAGCMLYWATLNLSQMFEMRFSR